MQRKKLLVLLWAVLFVLTACSNAKMDPAETSQQNTQVPSSKPAEPSAPPVPAVPELPEKLVEKPVDPPVELKKENPIGTEDTYWVIRGWYDEDGGEPERPIPADHAHWLADLIIRTDGTARFRDIRDGIYLMDDANLYLTWQRQEDGRLLFFSRTYQDPVLVAVWIDERLDVTYYGTVLVMDRSPVPGMAGELYAPAQLVGTWVMVSGETEGFEWNAMPSQLASLVFRTVPDEDTSALMLSGAMEFRDIYGYLYSSAYDLPVEVLQEQLHHDCSNELWSVRIGPKAPVDANGYPTEVEYYATMLEQDTLLMQRYFTLAGAPAVSYQTYRRMPQQVSWWEVEGVELEDSVWIFDSYVSGRNEKTPAEQELAALDLYLGENGECLVNRCRADGMLDVAGWGSWQIGNGGVVLIRGQGFGDDSDAPEDFWYGGAVRGFQYETEDGFRESYEMILHTGETAVRLILQGYG